MSVKHTQNFAISETGRQTCLVSYFRASKQLTLWAPNQGNTTSIATFWSESFPSFSTSSPLTSSKMKIPWDLAIHNHCAFSHMFIIWFSSILWLAGLPFQPWWSVCSLCWLRCGGPNYQEFTDQYMEKRHAPELILWLFGGIVGWAWLSLGGPSLVCWWRRRPPSTADTSEWHGGRWIYCCGGNLLKHQAARSCVCFSCQG